MTKAKADFEMEKFQAELLQSLREYKTGEFARKTEVAPTSDAGVSPRPGMPENYPGTQNLVISAY